MKYKTIINTDEFKDFKFFEDGIGPYMVAKDANACADNSEWIPLYFTEVDEESVLDKVRAEIEQLRLHKAKFITSDGEVCIDSQEVLNIIDKYMAENKEHEV